MTDNKKEKKKISLPVLIINIIVTAVFVFVFACLLIVMIQTFTGKEPTLFGYRSFVVVTESMTGTYDKGDVIIVKVVDGKKLSEDLSIIKEGDVVTFKAPEGFGAVEGYTVTHRVVKAPYAAEDGKYYIRTKGDAAQAVDETPVPLENVTGTVIGKSELLAGLQSLLKSKVGFLFLIVIPLVLIAVWQIAVFAVASAKNKKAVRERSGAEVVQGVDSAESEEKRIETLKKQAVEEYLKEQKDRAENNVPPDKGDPSDKD